MKLTRLCAALVAAGLALPAFAATDSATLEKLAARLEKLEARNAELEKQVQALKGESEEIAKGLDSPRLSENEPDLTVRLKAVEKDALEMKKAGDWNLLAGYKYIQPDALPDGFNDSSFHLGGTNAKGYFIGGNYGIDKNIYASARWLSASEVYGAPFEVDVMQLEINTRF